MLHFMQQNDESEERAVSEVIDRLSEKYPAVDRARIETIVAEEHLAFAGKPVRDFVAVLVEKSSKKRVKQLSKSL